MVKCEESGHLEVSQQTIGEVFIHTPEDPEGLWIHRSVADVLNQREFDEMRKGFRIGLFNSRGVTNWTQGEKEYELAEDYRQKAEEVELEGFQRLASVLRKLAETYDRQGNRAEEVDPFEMR